MIRWIADLVKLRFRCNEKCVYRPYTFMSLASQCGACYSDSRCFHILLLPSIIAKTAKMKHRFLVSNPIVSALSNGISVSELRYRHKFTSHTSQGDVAENIPTQTMTSTGLSSITMTSTGLSSITRTSITRCSLFILPLEDSTKKLVKRLFLFLS